MVRHRVFAQARRCKAVNREGWTRYTLVEKPLDVAASRWPIRM
jgi:hypothetical protein